MMVGVQGFESRLRNVGVNLRGRQIAVTEQQLYDTQIGSMIQ